MKYLFVSVKGGEGNVLTDSAGLFPSCPLPSVPPWCVESLVIEAHFKKERGKIAGTGHCYRGEMHNAGQLAMQKKLCNQRKQAHSRPSKDNAAVISGEVKIEREKDSVDVYGKSEPMRSD